MSNICDMFCSADASRNIDLYFASESNVYHAIFYMPLTHNVMILLYHLVPTINYKPKSEFGQF